MSRYLVGDYVELHDGRRGFIRFFGKVHFSPLTLYGIELTKGNGPHNGTFEHHTYFSMQCDHSNRSKVPQQGQQAQQQTQIQNDKTSVATLMNKRRHSIQLTQSYSQEVYFDTTGKTVNVGNDDNHITTYNVDSIPNNARSSIIAVVEDCKTSLVSVQQQQQPSVFKQDEKKDVSDQKQEIEYLSKRRGSIDLSTAKLNNIDMKNENDTNSIYFGVFVKKQTIKRQIKVSEKAKAKVQEKYGKNGNKKKRKKRALSLVESNVQNLMNNVNVNVRHYGINRMRRRNSSLSIYDFKMNLNEKVYFLTLQLQLRNNNNTNNNSNNNHNNNSCITNGEAQGVGGENGRLLAESQSLYPILSCMRRYNDTPKLDLEKLANVTAIKLSFFPYFKKHHLKYTNENESFDNNRNNPKLFESLNCSFNSKNSNGYSRSGKKRLCMIDCSIDLSKNDIFWREELESMHIPESMYLVSFQSTASRKTEKSATINKVDKIDTIDDIGNIVVDDRKKDEKTGAVKFQYLPILSLNYWLNNFSAQSSLNYLPYCALQIQLAVCEAFGIDVPGDVSFLKVKCVLLFVCLCNFVLSYHTYYCVVVFA